MQDRNLKVRRTLAAILAANWAVALIKIGFGVYARSASVTADGFHSLVDGASNILGLVAMSVAAQPADQDHPYGHGKYEALASLAIGAMMGVGMVELGRMAFGALVHDRHPEVSPELVGAMIATLAVNLVVTRVEKRIGERLKSPLLVADAQHTLSDVYVTLAVLGSLYLVHLRIPRADGAVALLVLGVVLTVAYGIIRQAIGILSDTARLDPDRVRATTLAVAGVLACRDVRSRGMEESVYVDLKIEVDPSLPTAAAHRLAHAVEERLTAEYQQVVDVVVHVEPSKG